MTAENQHFGTAGPPRLAEIATAEGPAVSNANPRTNERQSLVDIKGLGIYPMFKGECTRFTEAKEDHRVSDHCIRLNFSAVTDWVEEQDNVIRHDAL